MALNKPEAMSDADASKGKEPDFNAIAQQLRSEGLTYAQVEKQGTQALRDAPSVTLTNPEGSRASDKEFVMPDQKEGGTPESVQKLLQAYESIEGEAATPEEGNLLPYPERTPERLRGLLGGESDLIGEPLYQDTDLLSAAPMEVEQPADIKEQVFIASLYSESPFNLDSIKQESEKAIQGEPSIRDAFSTNSMSDLAKGMKEENLITSLGDNPAENAKKIKDFVAIENLQPESKKIKTQTDFYDSLTHTRVVPEEAFVFLNSQVYAMQALSAAASTELKPENLLEDFGEIITPWFGEVIYIDFQNALAESNSEKAMQLLMGNTSLDNVAKRYWSLPTEEQADYLTGIVSKLSETGTAGNTNNDILKLDLAVRIFEKIMEGSDKTEDFTYNDFGNFTWNFLSEVAIIFPVVKIVKDTIKMRQMSRIIGKTPYNSVELIGNRKSPAKDGEYVPKGDPVYPNEGTGTSLDIIMSRNPEEFRRLTNNREIKDVTDAMGVSPVDMPRRLLPRMAEDSDNLPQPNGVHHTYLSDSMQRRMDMNHLAQQLQKEEIDGLLPSYVSQVAKDMGETATPHLDKSKFEINEDASGGSLGTFVVRLGDSPDSGFKTVQDARTVASKLYGDNATVVRKTPYGNFSDDLMEGKNAYGDYFVQIKQEQQTTALSGKGIFLGGEGLVTGGIFKPLLNNLFDDDLLFNDKIQRTFSNMRDRANSFGVELERKAESLKSLATYRDDLDDFNMLSIKMQDKGIDTVDVIKMTELLGRMPSKRTMEALEVAREINSANWYIKNGMEYAAVSEDRFKTALIAGERYISKPFLNKPNTSDLKGTRIYDPESKTDLPLNQSVIDGLYEGGGVVATTYKPVKTATGEFNQIIIRNASRDIKPLQKDVSPYVKGHVQTSYKDDGFVVVGLVKKKIDGVIRTVPKAMGIAKNKTEASKLASALANRNVTLSKKPVVPTREYTSRMGIKSSASFALEMSVERGERIKGWHGSEFGVAEVVDPYSAYITSLYKTRKKYEQPTQDLMKQRFMDMNKDILKVSQFPVDISLLNMGDIFKDVVLDFDRIPTAMNFHRRIRLAEGGDLENASNMINAILRKTEMWAGGYSDSAIGSVLKPKLEAGLKSIDVTKAQAIASGLTNVRFIWGNALYQVLGPMAQTPFLLSQGPVVVAKALKELLYEFVPLVIAKDTDNLGTWHKAIASERGVDISVIEKEMDAILRSGMVRTVGKGQDYQTDMSFLLEALMKSKKTRGITVATGKALSLPIKLLKGSVLGAMDVYELLSFFIAKNTFLKSNKGADWTLPQNMEKITYDARQLSFNQNDTARLAWQNADNILKMRMALMSYTNRLYTRQFLDPLTLGFMSHIIRPKGSRKVNSYSKTPVKSLITVLVGAAMFGESYFDPLDFDFHESQKEYLRSIADGRFDKMLDSDAKAFFKAGGMSDPSNLLVETYYMGIHTSTTNMLFDGDVDWAEKYTNNSFAKAAYDIFANASTDNVTETLFGLPAAASAGLVNVIKHNVKMIMAMEDLDSRDAIFAGIEFASQLKIVDDAVAAYMAIGLERRITKSDFTPQEKTTFYEQISTILGGVPYTSAASYRGFTKADLPRLSSDNFQNYMIRKTQFELHMAFIKKDDDLTEAEASEIVVRNFRAMMQGEGGLLTEDGVRNFRREIVEVGKPIEVGGLTVDRSIQEKGISTLLRSTRQKTRGEQKNIILERLGIVKLQIKANPNEVSLQSEKEIIEIMLRELYDKTAEELNDEYLREVTN